VRWPDDQLEVGQAAQLCERFESRRRDAVGDVGGGSGGSEAFAAHTLFSLPATARAEIQRADHGADAPHPSESTTFGVRRAHSSQEEPRERTAAWGWGDYIASRRDRMEKYLSEVLAPSTCPAGAEAQAEALQS
jgi:hypothetical protein